MVRIIKYALTGLITVTLICAFAVVVLDIPMPWQARAQEPVGAKAPRSPLPGVELVRWYRLTNRSLERLRADEVSDVVLAKLTDLKERTLDREQFLEALESKLDPQERERYQKQVLKQTATPSHTLQVPEAVRRSLGIRRGNKDQLEPARPPTQSRPLVMPGSTALDPARVVRIRARFAPAEVVEIKKVLWRNDRGETEERELRPGDQVEKGQHLGIFHSVDVGSKKNDLFEAVIQYRLDRIILERAEEKAGALPEAFLWNARRNVQTDRSAIIRAKNTLKTWNIAEEDIQAVEKQANEYDLTRRSSNKVQEADWGSNQDKWARVIMKAPCSGVIVERNVARGEIVVDGTTNLFTIAQVDRMEVLVNLPEDDLKMVQNLKQYQRHWTIRTVGVNSDKGLVGNIDEIGYLIDPNQHTAVLKGLITNPKDEHGQPRLRAGQFVSATVELPPPADVVEIPINCLVDDGKQSLVFVQTDAAKHRYTMRRVVPVQRFEKTAFLSTRLLPPDKQLTPEEADQDLLPRLPLNNGEVLLCSGVLELKAALLDKEARQAQEE